MTNQTLIKNTGPFPLLRRAWRFLNFLGVCAMWFWIACGVLVGFGFIFHAIWFALHFGWRSFSTLYSLC